MVIFLKKSVDLGYFFMYYKHKKASLQGGAIWILFNLNQRLI